VSEHRDFIFGVQVDHSKTQPADNKLHERGMVTSCDPFQIFNPLKYVWNG